MADAWQQGELDAIADVMQRFARAIPEDLERAGASPEDIADAARDPKAIVAEITDGMKSEDIERMLHFGPMTLALQFIGAEDRKIAFAAAAAPYREYWLERGPPHYGAAVAQVESTEVRATDQLDLEASLEDLRDFSELPAVPSRISNGAAAFAPFCRKHHTAKQKY